MTTSEAGQDERGGVAQQAGTSSVAWCRDGSRWEKDPAGWFVMTFSDDGTPRVAVRVNEEPSEILTMIDINGTPLWLNGRQVDAWTDPKVSYAAGYDRVTALAEIIAKASWDAAFEEKASDAENSGLTVVDDWWDDKEPGEQQWRILEHRAAAMAVLRAGYKPGVTRG